MSTVVRVDVGLDDEEFVYLLSQAIRRGYPRKEPRKSWDEAEYKNAIRWYILRLVTKELELKK